MINEEKLYELLNRKEKVNFEVKSARGGTPQSIYETYSSFSNTYGGVIVLGIREEKVDKQIRYIFEGVTNTEVLISDIWNNLNNRQKVSYNHLYDKHIYALSFDNIEVVVMEVPRAQYNYKPIYVGNNPYTGSYKRNFEGDYHMDKESVNAMIRDSFSYSHDDEILEYFDIEDLDCDALMAYRTRFKYTNPAHLYNDLDDRTFLTKLGGYRIDKQRKIEGVTRAGVLMFGKTETFNHIYNGVNFDYRNETNLLGNMRWSDRVIENGIWEKNIYNFLTKVYVKVTSEFEVPFILKDNLQRIDDSRLHVAAREALANLVIHADFNEYPCNILVIKKENHIHFENTGLLRMSIDEVLQGGRSLPRNVNVQKMLRFIGFGESAGSGFDKIFAPHKYEEYPKPILSEDDTIRTTSLVIYISKEEEIQEKKLIPDIKLPKKQKIVYETIYNNPGLRIPKIAEICKMKEDVISTAIKGLKSKDMIDYEGTSKEGGYYVKPPTKTTD